MRLTKFVHSCLLVETDTETILFDPGQYSWESGMLNLDSFLTKLSTVVITHEHYDHMHLPFLKVLKDKFPEVIIVTTNSAAKILNDSGVTNVTISGTASIHIFSKQKHASLEPFGLPPENIAVHFADNLTVGGDRHDLEESKSILVLPVTAPWGSMMGAAAMALRLKPKHIIPVHDWHWNENARQQAYERLQQFFLKQGIIFYPVSDGVPIEIRS